MSLDLAMMTIIAAKMTVPQIAAIAVLALIVLGAFIAFRFNTSLQMRVSFNMDDESALYNKDGLAIYYSKNLKKFKKPGIVVVEIQNLTLGYKNHPKKGEYIVKIADTILKGMKDEETAARISFNKFVALLDDRDTLYIKEFCQRIENTLNADGFDGYTDLKYVLRFGVYETPEMKDVQSDVKLAEAAIAYSTVSERNIYYYNEQVAVFAAKEVVINKARKIAVEQKQFTPYIIPRVSIKSRKIVGGEIACRWVDARQEELYTPQEFLPIFEADGFIKQIDKLMFEAACLLAQSLAGKKVDDMVIAVNVSKKNFEDVNFADSLVEIAKNFNVDKKHIEIGLTGIKDSDSGDMIAKYVSDLKQRGFRVSSNGFGKSQQPLSAIISTSYDAYKLDDSFFANGLTTDKAKSAVIDVMNMISRQEAATICAGVGDVATMNFVASVDENAFIQGDVISKPVPVFQFDGMLTTKYEFNYKPLPKTAKAQVGTSNVSNEELEAQKARIAELEKLLEEERAKKAETVVVAAAPAPNNDEVEKLRKEIEEERNKNKKAEKDAQNEELEKLRKQLEEERQKAHQAELAARDSELEQLKKDMEALKKDAEERKNQEPIIMDIEDYEEEEQEEEAPKPAKKSAKAAPVQEEDDDDDDDDDLEEIDLSEDTEKEEEKLAKLMEQFKKQFRDQWEQEMLKKYPELMKKHNERLGFADRLVKLPAEGKEYFNSVKNEIMSYDGVTNITRRNKDTFVYNRKIIAKIAVSGKSIKVFLPLDPSKYSNAQFPHKDVSSKKAHVKTPFAMRMTSKLSTKRLAILFEDVARDNQMSKNAKAETKDYAKGMQFKKKSK